MCLLAVLHSPRGVATGKLNFIDACKDNLYHAPMALTHLRSLQALELALRTGALKDAAARLGITPAAVGQRIKALEEYLGLELLVRGRAGLRASPGLDAVMSRLSAAFRELEQVAAELDMQRGHEIHIAAAPDLAELWLQPRLVRFSSAFPNIRFSINGAGDAPMRIRPADCEITFGAPAQAGADELFGDFVLPVGSPENTARIGRLNRRDRLEGFPLLHLDFYKDDPGAPDWTQWLKSRKLRRTGPNRGIRYRRITTAIDAVLANAGFTLCGIALLQPMLDDHRLSLPFPVSTGAWATHVFQARFRADSLVRPQVRRFREWLATEAEGTRQWLARAASPQLPRRAPRRRNAAGG